MPTKSSDSQYREAISITKWLFVLLFFAIVPLAFLKFAEFSLINVMSSEDRATASEFSKDLPLITLAFWSGTMGTIVAYVYQRLNNTIPQQRLIYPIARFLFGGIVRAASYFVIRSGFIIKLLYPKLEAAALEASQLIDYRPVVAVAVISGLLAPTIVRAFQKKADDTA